MHIFANIKVRTNVELVMWCLIILCLLGQDRAVLALTDDIAVKTPESNLVEKSPLMSWRILGRFFRKHHNLSLSVGPSQGAWSIGQWGDLKGSLIPTNSVMARGQYTFHLPLLGSLGYMLGSSIGYEWEAKAGDKAFVPGVSFQLPGLLVGGVYNISPENRISLGMEVYLDRIYGMKTTNNNDIWTIDASMLALVDWFVGFEYFYEFNWGVKGEVRYRRLVYERPDTSVYTISNAHLEKEDQSVLIGVVYQWF